MAKRILITGANGLAGAEICNHFHKNDYDVIGIVRQESLANKQNICIDLSEPDINLASYFQNIDGVIHTAAVVPNRKSIANDETNKQKTITIDKNVAEFCKQKNIPTIYFSSCNLYKLKTTYIKNETSPIKAPTKHHEAKLIGENTFAKNQNTIIARINSPYGVNLSDEAVLKIFLSKAYNNETITIWGSGEREQDFIHVNDIANFTEKAIFSNQSGIFNVASGTQITMHELAKLCIDICHTGKINFIKNDDPNENYYPRFSIQKCHDVIDWKPVISLEDGIKSILKAWKDDNK